MRNVLSVLQVLGHGASGEVLLAIHKVTQQQFACKVVRKDTKMNDAQVRDEENKNLVCVCACCRQCVDQIKHFPTYLGIDVQLFASL